MRYCVASCIIIWDEETRSIYLLGSGPPGQDTDRRTPTALDRTLILSYYKGKVHFLLCLSVELTQMLYVPRVGQRHSFFSGKANASGPAYFRHLEGTFPAGGEFVEPCSVQDPP